MNKVLVVGASGATGKLLVKQLLEKGSFVTAIVRNSSALTQDTKDSTNLQLIEASVSELSSDDLELYVKGCDAVLSCLGHNLTFKGMFGEPKLLVTDTVEKVSITIESIKPDKKVKYILMNTSGNSNGDIPEKPPLSQRLMVAVVRVLLPPHADNEKAADFLRLKIGAKHEYVEWVVVRPDSLTDGPHVTEYDVYPSPIRNAIFDPGQTSRINVANFMANLVVRADLWNAWKGQMPVIYNRQKQDS